MTDEAGRQRLYLHIGLAKTGSTYLQAILRRNVAVLRDQGYCYPLVGPESMYHAAVEMASWPPRRGLTHEGVAGSFDALLDKGRRTGRTVVISHEIFGSGDERQVAAIFDKVVDFEVHVVVTVREPARLVVAQWQERVKNGHDQSFASYLDDRFSLGALPAEPDDAAYEELAKPELADKLRDRLALWGSHVPAERLHVVVVPTSGSDPTLLWDRFAESIELDPAAVDPSPPEGADARSNSSLGVPQIAFMRRVIAALDGRLPQPGFSLVAKRWFAQVVLAQLPGDRPALPPEYVAPMAWVGRRWICDIRESGVVVHGELDELEVRPSPRETRHPDEVTDAELAEVGSSAAADLLLEVERLREEVDGLRRQLRARRTAPPAPAPPPGLLTRAARAVARRTPSRRRRKA